jgi:hypothetical protein
MPPTRLTEPAAPEDRQAEPARVVTQAQIDQAVLQLRERRGRPPAEQLRAVLRALDLTVAGEPVLPEPRTLRRP